MNKFAIILITLLINLSYEDDPIGLTDCEIENDATTKTTASVSCKANETIADYEFVDGYLKLEGKTDKTKSASLASCAKAECGTAVASLYPCTFKCSKVTGEEKDVEYLLKKIETAAANGVFKGTNAAKVVTLAPPDSPTKNYKGQEAAANPTGGNNSGDGTGASSFIKYTLIALNILLF